MLAAAHVCGVKSLRGVGEGELVSTQNAADDICCNACNSCPMTGNINQLSAQGALSDTHCQQENGPD